MILRYSVKVVSWVSLNKTRWKIRTRNRISQQCTYKNEFGPADRNQIMQKETGNAHLWHSNIVRHSLGRWAGTTLYSQLPFKRSTAFAASETIPWATFERHRWLPFVPIASFSSRTRVSHFASLLLRCTEDACRRLIEPLRDPGSQQNESMVNKPKVDEIVYLRLFFHNIC